MKSSIKYWLPLLAFLGIIALFSAGLKLDPREIPSPLIGQMRPDFKRPVLYSENQFFSPDDLLGKVWLLNIWASWCSSCADEHSLLMEMSQNTNVPIVGLDYKDDLYTARKLLATKGNPYSTVATDPDGLVGIDFGVYGVPETYLIDKKGVIRFKQTGAISPGILQQKLLPLIYQLKNE
jgi:cytochrome c biogenesis protein CcmG/thiol:disulfide interchange protein DsbE